MRPIREWRSASKENYELFCTNNPKIHITFKEYKEIIYTYNSQLALYLLETGNKLKIPYGLGELVINKYKPKKYRKDSWGEDRINLGVDWKQTKIQGKKIYLLNAHTEGYKFYWMWNYWKSKIKLSYVWKVEMARVHSRMLNVYLTKPNSKYKDIYKLYPRMR